MKVYVLLRRYDLEEEVLGVYKDKDIVYQQRDDLRSNMGIVSSVYYEVEEYDLL